MCFHTQTHTNLDVCGGFLKVKEFHCSFNLHLHATWTVEESTEYTEGFFVSRSAPEQLEVIYPNLEKRINESLVQPSSAALTCSSPGHLISDSPHPPGSPSPNLSSLPLGLPGGPSDLPSPEHDLHSSSPELWPDAWPSDPWTIVIASLLNQACTLAPTAEVRIQALFFLWTDGSTHLSPSHIEMGAFRHLNGMSSQWWYHLCMWSLHICWKEHSFWAPVAPGICTIRLALLLFLWWTDSTVTSHDSPLIVFIPLCDPLSLSVSRTCDLLLINGIWQRGWAGTSRTALHEWDASLLTLSLLRFSLLDWRCEWLCSQQAASSLQPTGSRGPHSCSCRKINSANCLNELGSGFFPSRVSRGEPSPVDALIATSWDPKQRTQTSDPQKLWGNRYHRNYDIMNTDQWIVPLCINYLHHFFGWVITVTQPTSISLVWCIKWNYFLKWDY